MVERGGVSLLVSVYDGTGGVPETDAHLESAGLEKMSPPSPVVSGRQHSVGKCTHNMLYTSHICFKHTYFHKKYHSSCNFIGWIRGGGGGEIPSSLLPRGHTVWNCVMLSLGEDLMAHCVMNHGWKGRDGDAVGYCCM